MFQRKDKITKTFWYNCFFWKSSNIKRVINLFTGLMKIAAFLWDPLFY